VAKVAATARTAATTCGAMVLVMMGFRVLGLSGLDRVP
jgi:hypothetical protein